MARVKYLPYGNGKRVSTQWHRVLTAADRARVGFTLTSGHRTFAEQQALFDQNMIRPGVPKPNHPMTAVPSHTAPHIRTGFPNHALDVNSRDGGETRLERWIERQGANIEWVNTVANEAWHGEVSREDLARLFRKFRPKPPPTPPTDPLAQGAELPDRPGGREAVRVQRFSEQRHVRCGTSDPRWSGDGCGPGAVGYANEP